jgi:hypothetical protein
MNKLFYKVHEWLLNKLGFEKHIVCRDVIYLYLSDVFYLQTNKEFIKMEVSGKIRNKLINIARMADENKVVDKE